VLSDLSELGGMYNFGVDFTGIFVITYCTLSTDYGCKERLNVALLFATLGQRERKL